MLAAHRPIVHAEEANKIPPAAPLDRQSLLALIQQQLEFYFSEENLPKDVFLLKQIEKDKTKEGYVSLKVIAGFPKMKKLTHDLGAIREAAEGSSIVVLSSDGLSVKRKIPLVLPEDTTEKRTLYVTRLPKDADRESLMLVFSEFGTVVRLDLPMDKKTGEHKGMAFVEFQAEEELRKALEDFTTSNKYKMIVKPFKSRNSKEISSPIKETEDYSDDENEEKKGGSKPGSKRNSKETKDLVEGTKRNSAEMPKKRNSKETKDLIKETSERRKSLETKPENRRRSNDAKDLAKQEINKKGSKETKRISKEYKDGTGREVPIVPDSAYESYSLFNHNRARGANRQRNSDKILDDPDVFLNVRFQERPKFHIKNTDGERPLFVPIRNPIGPDAEGTGFGRGRGKNLLAN